jgi:hypothetical protein
MRRRRMGFLQDCRQAAKSALRGIYRGRGLLYFAYRSTGEPSYPFLCLHAICWQVRSAITGEALAHLLGDSHATPYNFGKRMVVHHIGQATAHNLWEEKSSSGSKKIFLRVLRGISPGRDVVGLVFGEIDCRIHFHYQHKKAGKPYAALMDATIERYGEAMDEVRRRGVRFFVVGVPPVGRQENVYGYPFYGSMDERRMISQKFRQRLAAYCRKRGVPYFDPYSFAADGKGMMKKEYCRDDIHLNGRARWHLEAFLEKFFPEKFLGSGGIV